MRRLLNTLLVLLLLSAPTVHGEPPTALAAVGVYLAASPEEQASMARYSTVTRADRQTEKRQHFLRDYVAALCAIKDPELRVSEFAAAWVDAQIVEVTRVADPLKAELLGNVLVECTPEPRIVSGQVDTGLIAQEIRSKPQGAVTVEVVPIECRPIKSSVPTLCDERVAGASNVRGCESRPKTTCDPEDRSINHSGASELGDLAH